MTWSASKHMIKVWRIASMKHEVNEYEEESHEQSVVGKKDREFSARGEMQRHGSEKVTSRHNNPQNSKKVELSSSKNLNYWSHRF